MGGGTRAVNDEAGPAAPILEGKPPESYCCQREKLLHWGRSPAVPPAAHVEFTLERRLAMAAKKKAAKKAVKKTAKKKTVKKAAKKKTASKRKPSAAFMKPMKISAALAAVIGAGPYPRTEVTKRLWAYIKKSKLQDAKNKRDINADAKLKVVFGGRGKVNMFEMTKLVSKHLS